MGVFNPNAPHILGQEWVPIRDELFTLDSFRETGYTFTTTGTRAITQGRFYLGTKGLATVSEFDPIFQMSVYPYGMEVQTGPIERVVIPVMSGTLGGTSSMTEATVQESLSSPLGASVVALGDAGSVDLRFNTTAYSTLLYGKRILRANITGTASGSEDADNLDSSLATASIGYSLEQVDVAKDDIFQFTVSMSEVSPFWSTGAFVAGQLHPWRYSELARLSTTGGSPGITATLAHGGPTNSNIDLYWVALELYYCNETRVAVGAKPLGDFGDNGFQFGQNQIILRDNALLTPISLLAGAYTVTLNLVDFTGGAFGF